LKVARLGRQVDRHIPFRRTVTYPPKASRPEHVCVCVCVCVCVVQLVNSLQVSQIQESVALLTYCQIHLKNQNVLTTNEENVIKNIPVSEKMLL
jgi:hypothetical protein